MKRKLFSLITIIFFVTLVGCGGNANNETNNDNNSATADKVAKEGMPVVEDEITLDFFAGQTPQSNDDWNDVLIFNEYEEMTNVDINWEMVPAASLEEKKNLRLASDDLPDAFHTVGMSDDDLMKYGDQGTFIKLNDLIDDYAPNFKKLMEDYPEIEKGVTMQDGGIYSFPTVEAPEFLSMRMAAKPFINEEWLETLDMDMPETTDEFYEYLKAVKEEDPGNNDGVPYGAPDINQLLSWVKGSFDISNKGFQNFDFDTDPETDELRFYPTSDSYKEMLEYVNKLYDEELIEQNIFSIELDQFLANGAEGLYGSTNWYQPDNIFDEAGEAFVGAPALEGPNGVKKYIGLRHPVVQKGVFTITKENEHPEATVRWMDHFYSDEGAQLFFMGVEGETFEVTDDGDYEFVEELQNDAQAIAEYLTYPGGGAPGIFKEKYFKGAESSQQELDSAEILEPYTIDDPWPEFSYTKDEMKVVTSIGSDIAKYIEEMQDKFIAGDTPFSEWDNYVQTIEDMGLEERIEVEEAAYERYMDN